MTGRTAGLLSCVALAITLRLGMAVVATDWLSDDRDDYIVFARCLAGSGVYGSSPDQPSAFRAPGYPLLLLPWCRHSTALVFGVAALNLLASAVIVVATWRLVELGGFSGTAWVAALIVAIDPLLLQSSLLPMSETVFTALLVGLLFAWAERPSEGSAWRWRGLAALLVTAAAMTRPLAWAIWLLLGLACLLTGRRRDWCWITLAAIFLCLPWVVRNQVVLGRPILTTTHGGYTLWLGQNPVYFREVVAGPNATWPAASFQDWSLENTYRTRGKSELQRNDYYRDQALRWMIQHPRNAARSIGHHLVSLWGLAPNYGPRLGQFLCSVFYGIVFALAVLGLFQAKAWAQPFVILPVTIVATTAVHAVYWSNLRMRTPLMPVLAILAAWGLGWLWRRFGPE
ncbi:hypothetical protein Pan216_55450 [Planctomycetes bacterium Pan216]|uniref:Glycosyltransferase RgtA/B/C/D-like domain-containing protein n=1 Tax=Kolteria novifilia TaxID=2527975 RepID=A0A518BCE8_9BACT|nr:hypothetical protein Pan216_55450 [Planctomycetes bacterium Pan216]